VPITETASWSHEFRLTMATNFGTTTPSVGQYWYAAGSTVGTSATAPGTITGERYVWSGWTGTGTGSYTGPNNSATITMNAPITQTASWTHQYYLTVASPYDSPAPTSTWFDAGTSIIASVTSPWADSAGTRYVCTGWTGTGSVPPSGSSASLDFTINAPSSIIWNWKTQYYLTITYTSGGVTNPADSGWFDVGSTASVTAIPDPDYVLNRWDLDGSPVGSANPYNVLMNSAHTLHAVFEYSPPPPTAHYLTVKTDPLGITPILGQGLYDEGENVTLTAPSYVDVSTGTRYKFAYWDVDGTPRGAGVNPITVIMNANHTATAHYTLQYYLTVTSPYDTPTPTSGWFDAGTPITASVTSPWAGPTGTTYVCTGWTGAGSVPASGTAASVAFTINAPSSISWNWKTQYNLTVETVPSGIVSIPGAGWYDMSTTVPLTAPNVTGYEFHYWDLNGTPQGNGVRSISVTMNMPYTATAHYLPIIVGGSAATIELHLTHTWIGTNSILAAAFCIAAFYMKKRRKRV
ncbi:MAG: hypothetical protein WCC63_05730, partial [Candidatus Bathyarchaeia archaeon]